MNTKQGQSFGNYLRNLRESRELSAKAVEKKIMNFYPEDKYYHLSAGHLTQIERGAAPPYPLKLKALAQVYGENYELMLYKAGYLDRNPLTSPKEWNHKILRDLYFESLTSHKKLYSLTEAEKLSIEKVLETLIKNMTQKTT